MLIVIFLTHHQNQNPSTLLFAVNKCHDIFVLSFQLFSLPKVQKISFHLHLLFCNLLYKKRFLYKKNPKRGNSRSEIRVIKYENTEYHKTTTNFGSTAKF